MTTTIIAKIMNNSITSEAKFYNIVETKTSFEFQNEFNMYVELDKVTGNLKTSNLSNNVNTQKLFKALFNIAIQLKNLSK